MNGWNRIRHRVGGWIGRADLIVLLAVLAAVVGLLAFFQIADEVTEGDTHEIDQWVIQALRDPADPAIPIGPHWLRQAAVDVSALGGYAVLTLMLLSVAGFLLLARKYHALVLVLAATVGGAILSTLLKAFFDRPRPDLVPHLALVDSASFPSGHAMLSAVVYLTLGSLLARLVAKRGLKLYFIGVALLITFLVGLTRVYLGVHWPSDVLAGWAAGLVWAVTCWLVARFLQHRGAVEMNLAPGGSNHDQSTGSPGNGGRQGSR